MWGFFKKKTLDNYLGETKKVKINGIKFKIKKINVVDHLHGSLVLTEQFHIWRKSKVNGNSIDEAKAFEKIKKHYREVFLSAVLDPVLCSKEDEAGPGITHVDRLFIDFSIAQELYTEIMMFTHGKKKIKEQLMKHR